MVYKCAIMVALGRRPLLAGGERSLRRARNRLPANSGILSARLGRWKRFEPRDSGPPARRGKMPTNRGKPGFGAFRARPNSAAGTAMGNVHARGSRGESVKMSRENRYVFRSRGEPLQFACQMLPPAGNRKISKTSEKFPIFALRRPDNSCPVRIHVAVSPQRFAAAIDERMP